MTPSFAHRRTPALLLTGLLVATLTGCSGDDEPRATPTTAPTTAAPSPLPPSPSPSPSPPEVPLTSARAMAIARAVVLKQSDVPALMKSEDGDADASPAELDEDDPFATCAKDQAANLLASFASPTFAKGAELEGFSVESTTDVVARTAQARKDFAALTAPSLLPCLNKALATSFANDPETEGASLSGSFTRVPTTKPEGADGAARFAYQGTVAAPGVSIEFSVNVTTVLVGRASTALLDTAFGSERLAGPDRDTLVGILVQRARNAQGLTT